jgi:hypothetical protein
MAKKLQFKLPNRYFGIVGWEVSHPIVGYYQTKLIQHSDYTAINKYMVSPIY